ncbi:MAG: hypothetical protein SP4CHLAM5_12010 [Chlamydiia bacterium]|nr:hypothetical protein [Chlamydiia bacterium]MCH9619055.1 hypothetical protein [Chlamydiia bacterium]
MNITTGNLLAPLGDTSSDPDGYAEGSVTSQALQGINTFVNEFQGVTITALESSVESLQLPEQRVSSVFRFISALKPIIAMKINRRRYCELKSAYDELTPNHYQIFRDAVYQMSLSHQVELINLMDFLDAGISRRMALGN